MKRQIALMLLAGMLLTAVGCGDTAVQTQETNAATEAVTTAAETLPPEPLDLLPRKDFDGASYAYLDANDYQEKYQNVPGDEETGDILNDGLYRRGVYVEENFNVDMQYQVTKAKEGYTLVRGSVLAGDDSYQLLNGGIQSGMNALATEGILYNLCQADEMTLDEIWWSGMVNENLRFREKLYITTGDITPTMYSMLAAVYINRKLTVDYGVDKDYYGLVRGGLWTLDELSSLTRNRQQDLNGDGEYKASDDFFGLVYARDSVTSNGLIVASGIRYSTVSGGDIVVDLNNEKVAGVVEDLKPLFEPLTYSSDNEIMATFSAGRALALVHLSASGINWFRDMEDDFYELPMPKYNEKQDSYYSYANTWTDAYVAVPLTGYSEMSGTVTEALARYSYQYIRPAYYELALKQKGTRDENASEMLDLIFRCAYVDFNIIYDFGGTRAAVQKILFNDLPFASTMEALTDAANTAVAEFIENY